jgi:ABC-2 type transport system permease protein
MSETTMDDDKEARDSDPAPAAPAPAAAFTRSGSGTKNIMTIAKRELAAYLNTPVAYILICVTLVLMGAYFFWYEGNVWAIERASMVRLLVSAPVLLCSLTIPLFTMRTLSEEKRMGTIELLITMPVTDSEVILGKYFAALAMVTIQLILLIAYPLVMFRFPYQMGGLDWGPFWAGMLGLFLMSAAGIAIGLMYSSMTENQIVSFFATAVTLSALYWLGPALSSIQSLKGQAADFFAFFSFQTRYESFARGLLDTRSIVYFVSIAVFGCLVAFRNLESRKWS